MPKALTFLFGVALAIYLTVKAPPIGLVMLAFIAYVLLHS